MESGYYVIKNFIDDSYLNELQGILENFHAGWCRDNSEFYQTKAINSAYITSGKYLSTEERIFLLKFISSKELIKVVSKYLDDDIAFLNSQLFFNPVNTDQRNYWHRDIQYSGLDESEQRRIIESKEQLVFHFRLALKDEPGLELIPGSQDRWDYDAELDTRLEREGRRSSDNLSNTKVIKVDRGDLLVFDANIIHRGIYGLDRLSFDLLFCNKNPDILKYADKACFPNREELKLMDNPDIFTQL
ncbi:MAG: hypothetical protein BM556_01600 [Bacteriovorax sp. MedPE-SWde]|nr:MAG: hypothetical protein BM556_01600 [Bacteriovorax sp. MedPE-SWde]